MNFQELSNAELETKIIELTGKERTVTLELLRYLIELERRALFRELGYSSLFDYCTRKLKYSEASAYKRISAARVLRDNPEVEALYLKGELSLCTLAMAQKMIRRKETSVSQICGKSKREVEALVFKCEVPAKPQERVVPVTVSSPSLPLLPETPKEERYSLKFSLSKEDYERLQEAKAKLSHSIGQQLSIEGVITKLLDRYLAKPREKRSETHPSSRYISRSVKHEVFSRDKGQCCYISPDGTRCRATNYLQYDHRVPFALGGSTDASNLRLLCPAHNKLLAERVFGKEFIDRHIQQ